MALNQQAYSTRSLSLVMLAALAGIGLWMFTPSFPAGSGSTGSGGSDLPSGPGLPAMLRVDGAIATETQGGIVTTLTIPISIHGTGSVDLSSGKLRAETALAETALAVVPATYTVEWQGGNGDGILDTGETAVLQATLPASSSVRADDPLAVVFTPHDGPALRIEDVLGR